MLVALCLSFWIMSYPVTDTEELLIRKWMMVEMQIEGKKYGESMLERQRSKGLVTILQFAKGGLCYVFTKSPKGKTTKKNKWKLSEDGSKLTIQPEEGSQAQSFDIVKISSKKLVLSLNDGKNTQVFTYKALKD